MPSELVVVVESSTSSTLIEFAAEAIATAEVVVARRVVEITLGTGFVLGESETGLTVAVSPSDFAAAQHLLEWEGPCPTSLDGDVEGVSIRRQAVELESTKATAQQVVVECPSSAVPALLEACAAARLRVSVVQEGYDSTFSVVNEGVDTPSELLSRDRPRLLESGEGFISSTTDGKT